MLSYMCIGISVKYPLFLSELTKFEFSRQIFLNILISSYVKIRPIKLRENPSSGSRVVACGRKDGRDEANTLKSA